MGRFVRQVQQVCMTYLTQRYLGWGAALLALLALPFWLTSSVSRRGSLDAAPAMLMVLGMPMLIVLPLLVGQVKTQFAHSRARLLPRFLPAHWSVLCGILVTVLVLYPFLLANRTGFEPLGLVALAIAIGVPAIWSAHFLQFAPALISLIVFYSLLTDWGLRWWVVEASENRELHALVVAAGVVFAVAWLWRLCHLNEEMEDYQNPYLWLMARRTGSEAIEQRRIVAAQVGRNRLAGWIGDQWHSRLGGYFGGSKVGLIRILRYGFAANPIQVQGVLMAAMFLAMGIFLNQFSIIAKGPANIGGHGFMVMIAIMLPGYMAGESIAQRRPRIAFEMLLPLSRTWLIDGLFVAAARNALVLWLMMNAALAIVVASASDEISLRTVAMFLLLSGSTMFAATGVSLRMSIWPSLAKRIVLGWVSWMAFIQPLVAWWWLRDTIGDAPFNLIAILLIAVGVWLIHAARHAWLNLELG